MTARPIPLLAIAALLGAGAARAQTLDQEVTGPVTGALTIGAPANSPLGQEFVPTLDGLDAVELLVNQSNPAAPVDVIVVAIHAASITGPVLGTLSLLPGALGSGFTWLYFDLGSQAIRLNPGSTYVLEASSPTLRWGWARSALDPYPAGRAILAGVPVPGEDLFIRTWGSRRNRAPTADPGGPYLVECQGTTTAIPLDGSASSDPDGDPLVYAWTSDCPGASFDDPTRATPVLTLASAAPCPLDCHATLHVEDPLGEGDTRDAALQVHDTRDPVALPGLALEPPAPPAPPRSACSAPASRLLRVVCAGSDACDAAPVLEARILATHHDVAQRNGPCATRVDAVPVACDELVWLELLAPPCPAKPPASPRSSLVVRSDGVKLVRGEELRLEVSAQDACGSRGVALLDPTEPPPPPCDEPRTGGTCCPALGAPAAPRCPVPACGRWSQHDAGGGRARR